jgi:hypothetical protein
VTSKGAARCGFQMPTAYSTVGHCAHRKQDHGYVTLGGKRVPVCRMCGGGALSTHKFVPLPTEKPEGRYGRG